MITIYRWYVGLIKLSILFGVITLGMKSIKSDLSFIEYTCLSGRIHYFQETALNDEKLLCPLCCGRWLNKLITMFHSYLTIFTHNSVEYNLDCLINNSDWIEWHFIQTLCRSKLCIDHKNQSVKFIKASLY